MSVTMETPAAPEKANGLSTYLKVIYAPGDAFATLARVPTWGWAAIIGTVLAIVGALLVLPASLHYQHIIQEKQFSQMPADQAAAARAIMAKVPSWVGPLSAIIVTPIITWFFWELTALGFLIGAALGGGEARHKMAWTAVVNAYIVVAIGSIAGGIILSLRGAESVNSAADLYALPSPVMFFHPASVKLTAFLYYAFNIASIWYFIVAVIALENMLKLGRTAAVVTMLVLLLGVSGLFALFAR